MHELNISETMTKTMAKSTHSHSKTDNLKKKPANRTINPKSICKATLRSDNATFSPSKA